MDRPEFTDSQLKAQWNALVEKWKTADAPGRERLRDEERLIRKRWEANRQLRRRGQITDRTAVDLAIKAADENFKIAAIPVDLREAPPDAFATAPMDQDAEEDLFVRWWNVTAIYKGDPDGFREVAWSKTVAAITREMLSGGVPVLKDKASEGRFDHPLGLKDGGEAAWVVGAIWSVDTSAWDGPPRRLS